MTASDPSVSAPVSSGPNPADTNPAGTGSSGPGDAVRAVFAAAGCEGSLCVLSLDGRGTWGLAADRPVSPASVVKVPIALEAETRFADGRLDPRERVVLRAGAGTPGPVGFSLYEDDVEVSLRDLVTAMLTLSDNVATDVLLARVGGPAAVTATLARLGLPGTVLTADIRTTVDSLGRAAGFRDWADLVARSARLSAAETARADAAVLAADPLDPAIGDRTTPRETAELLARIWADEAGPAEACARVRAVMGRQLTRHRLASAFRAPTRVAAKSGSLIGTVRNEAGVITLAGGRRYAAAVFTRSPLGSHEAPINSAIGRAAALAVDHLESAGA